MEQQITIGQNTVHYWTHHTGKKPVIVMIHGFTGDHTGFQNIVPLLTDFQLIIPDLPGCGSSSLPAQDSWSIDGIAQLANQFVAALNLPTPPIIFGHSMGGLVVASMVHQAPQLYANEVVLLSPVPSKITWRDSRFVGAKLGELQYLVGHAVPVVGPAIIKSQWLTTMIADILTTDRRYKQFTREQMLANLTKISSLHFYYLLQRSINRRGAIDYADSLAKKRLLVINGDIDPVVPLPRLEPLVRHTNAAFTLINGVGHDAHYERAPEVAQSMTTFLQQPTA